MNGLKYTSYFVLQLGILTMDVQWCVEFVRWNWGRCHTKLAGRRCLNLNKAAGLLQRPRYRLGVAVSHPSARRKGLITVGTLT